jgi:hypothetical protein
MIVIHGTKFIADSLAHVIMGASVGIRALREGQNRREAGANTTDFY